MSHFYARPISAPTNIPLNSTIQFPQGSQAVDTSRYAMNGQTYLRSAYPALWPNFPTLQEVFATTSALSSAVAIHHAFWLNNRYLMSGTNTNTLYETPNGLDTFTERTAVMPSSTDWRWMDFNSGVYVAIPSANGTLAATSTDLVTWASRTLPAAGNWSGCAFGNGNFVTCNYNATAFASPSAFATSPTGTTWTGRNAATAGNYIDVAFGNGRHIAISRGEGSFVCQSSTDGGVNWANSGTLPNPGGSTRWQHIVFGNGIWVVTGVSSTNVQSMCFSTDNGANWTNPTYTGAAQFGRAAHMGGGVWVFSTGGQAVRMSFDNCASIVATQFAINAQLGIYGLATNPAIPNICVIPNSAVGASRVHLRAFAGISTERFQVPAITGQTGTTVWVGGV